MLKFGTVTMRGVELWAVLIRLIGCPPCSRASISGYTHNERMEQLVTKAVLHVKEIDDTDVRRSADGRTVWVRSSTLGVEWEARQPESEWAGCNCPEGR